MKARVIAALGLTVWLVGCVTPNPKQLDADTVRTETNLRQEAVFAEMNLPQIQRQLYIHREHCNIEFRFRMEPNQVHYATVFYGLPDQTDLAQQAIINLTAYSSGKVQATGYSYYAQQAYLVDAFLQAIAKPEQCAEGITKKE